MIAPNIILLWAGTNASIPSGFSRETSLDSKYPKSSGGEAPNTTGGSNTHSHTATTHGHNLNAHTHAVILSHTSGPPNASSRNDTAADNHGHVTENIGGTSGGSLQNTVVTWSSVNHEPPYFEVIFIKATSFSLVPASSVGLFNSATIPSNFAFCDGAAGTPDMRNRYIKGAAAAGDGGTTGGSLNHSHSVTHGHTANGHTHSQDSGLRDNGGNRGIPGSNTGSTQGHRHTVTLNSTADTVNSYTNTSAGSADTVEPDYRKVLAVQNTSAGLVTVPFGLIALWLGTVATIPPGWYICDGTKGTPNLQDKFIKIANTTGEIGNTGGSNTHTHSAISHTHTATGTHTHSGSTGGPTATLSADSGGEGYATSTHTHALGSVSSETASYDNTLIDADTVSNQPAYRTAAYIQFAFPIGGSALMALI